MLHIYVIKEASKKQEKTKNREKSSLSGETLMLIIFHVTTTLKMHLSFILHRSRKCGMRIQHENCYLHRPYSELLCYANSVNLKTAKWLRLFSLPEKFLAR